MSRTLQGIQRFVYFSGAQHAVSLTLKYMVVSNIVCIAENRFLHVPKNRSSRSIVAKCVMMLSLQDSILRLTHRSSWSDVIRKGPGLCTRHVDKTYKSSVSDKRGIAIGSMNEIILWPEELEIQTARLYSAGFNEQVYVIAHVCALSTSHSCVYGIHP